MDFTDRFHDTLARLADTPGKKDKEAIVSGMSLGELSFVADALDPTKPFYIAKLPLPDYASDGRGLEVQQDLGLLADLTFRRVTGNAALQRIAEHFSQLNWKAASILHRCILKDLRCGVGAGTINRVHPGAIPDFAYMRCSLPKDAKLDQWPWAQGVFSELKADGMFARIRVENGVAQITSRQGLTFPRGALADIESAALALFPDGGVELHGELTIRQDGKLMHRKDSNGILNSMQDGGGLPEVCTVMYDAWDLVPARLAVPGGRDETPYVKRFAALLDVVRSRLQAVIDVIEYRMVYSRQEASDHFLEMLAKGLEGTVVKHPDMVWADGDSRGQIKYKLEFEVDLKIAGFNPGEPGKRTEATFGSLICESACGTLQVGVSGFKREMEAYLHENRDLVIGGVITVRANDIVMPSDSSTLYALSHPRFVELRRDKGMADTLPHIINQLEAARAGKATT